MLALKQAPLTGHRRTVGHLLVLNAQIEFSCPSHGYRAYVSCGQPVRLNYPAKLAIP